MSVCAAEIARQFTGGTPDTVVPLGSGLINDTFLVTWPGGDLVLQRLNSRVFPQPALVMDNLAQLNRHAQTKPADQVQLRIPAIIATLSGHPVYRDGDGHYWRALERIAPAQSRDNMQNAAQARAVGLALAQFHTLCSDLSPDLLHDTLPGFHITPEYFAEYRQLRPELPAEQADQVRACCAYIESCSDKLDVLEQAKRRGELRQRVIHGDPKLNNFLFEPDGDRIVSLIDLDTVKPGLIHYDIGDCIRSCCHDKSVNRFDLPRARLILHSYLQAAGGFLTAADFAYLYPAIWLIPFELGLRFFTDYLRGNRYFKIEHPEHNLQRSQALFALCDDIERQKSALSDCIAAIAAGLEPAIGHRGVF
ncbi:phosphotransferase enzyme family protein [Methylomonas rhizoryzae]|uniref:phosphotransferase enzyme family protein n=1 Tax=Methylomonas rhizoryzae TaxID=2608981 RepID=UPI0012321BA0|nr:aminoglycoside phosphotransferase family protein [Methylomonas rhizoryzae]